MRACPVARRFRVSNARWGGSATAGSPPSFAAPIHGNLGAVDDGYAPVWSRW